MTLLDDIKQRLDIVDVMSQYVELKPSGRNLKARCPFHAERTPSFFVFPERQTWRCFGACATGGDVLSFVMKVEHLPFAEALRLLAQRAGVSLPRGRTEEQPGPLHRINQLAAAFYQQELLLSAGGAEALRYLESRGGSRDSIREFGLGLSPQRWDALWTHLAAQGFAEELVLQAGLVVRTEDGRLRDLFHGRLMFPIHDGGGRVVGFGGRALDKSDPKYLNSPKTPLFDKGQLLYGLHLAAEAIRREGLGVLVEGYMDVIIAHQARFRNVVASMGTALTDRQVAQLRRLASRFLLALDPDAAGQEATVRSLETSWQRFRRPALQHRQRGGMVIYERSSPLELKIALLPQGKDPDEIILETPSLWAQAVAGGQPLLDFLFDVLPPRYDLATTLGKRQLVERLGSLILALEDFAEQDKYLQRLEELVGVNRRVLEEAMGLTRRTLLAQRARDERIEVPVAPLARAAGDPLEEYALALLLQHPDLEPGAAGLQPEHFQRAENREVFTEWIRCSTIDSFKAALPEVLQGQVARLLERRLPPSDGKERQLALVHCASRLEERLLRELKVQEELLLSQTPENPPGDFEEQALELNRRLHGVFVAAVEKGRKG